MLPSSSITFSRRTSLARPMGAGINIRYERPHINYFIADSRVRPDLTDADALMWIERRLRDPHLARHRFARCSPVGRPGGEESTRIDFAGVPGSPACHSISK